MPKEQLTARWRGISLVVSYEPSFLGRGRAHLEIEVADRRPVSLTPTGYRSHFTSTDEIAAAGGPVEYALALLDVAEAGGPEAAMRWRAAPPASPPLRAAAIDPPPSDDRWSTAEQLSLFGEALPVGPSTQRTTARRAHPERLSD